MDNTTIIIAIASLIAGWLMDKMLGDPEGLPHPIVAFGKAITWGERRFNHGDKRAQKGMYLTIILIVLSFGIPYLLLPPIGRLSQSALFIISAISIFYCLAGTTLIREVRMVFTALDSSLELGRQQLSRIVGRDTGNLTPQQIRIAALETLSENLSDGVIAPLFWYLLLGIPGIFAYKMINTLDSMIGYKNERYLLFGRTAAKIDDIANYVPSRLTALIMLLLSGKISQFRDVIIMAKNHSSPNAGYPEAALAYILDCRFGGPNNYFGSTVNKPYIGHNDREIGGKELNIAIRLNKLSEMVMIFAIIIIKIIIL